MKWLLRALWRQIKYCLWIGGFLAGGYVAAEYFHQFWVGSIMFFIAVIIVVAWVMSLFDSETWANSGYDYDDRSRRSRESPFEVQRQEFEEDMNRYQREEEDRLYR